MAIAEDNSGPGAIHENVVVLSLVWPCLVSVAKDDFFKFFLLVRGVFGSFVFEGTYKRHSYLL